jgi:hypothetical protein
MSETKHTAGPWHTEPHRTDGLPVSIGICAGDPDGDPNEINVLGYAALESGTQADNAANATLWSASPELLAACQETLNEMRAWQGELEFEDGPFKDVCDQLKTAIAKAEGQIIKEPSNT